jgi:hypothetical protein
LNTFTADEPPQAEWLAGRQPAYVVRLVRQQKSSQIYERFLSAAGMAARISAPAGEALLGGRLSAWVGIFFFAKALFSL